MSTPILLRKKTPFDGVPPEVFADLSAFVRRAAPRWEDESSNLDRSTQRHAHQRELARSRQRGYRLVTAPVTSASSGPASSGRAIRQRLR